MISTHEMGQVGRVKIGAPWYHLIHLQAELSLFQVFTPDTAVICLTKHGNEISALNDSAAYMQGLFINKKPSLVTAVP